MQENNAKETHNPITSPSLRRKVRGKQLLWGLVLVFAITVAAIYTFWPSKKPENPLVAVNKIEKDSPLLTDEDTDGLLLWEEELYRTDSKNPDTDADGISDGDEVKNGTNPLDPLNDEIAAPFKETQFQNPPYSNLTRSLFDEFASEGGAELLINRQDPTIAANLLTGKLGEYLSQGKLSSRPPLRKDLPIRQSEDTSPEAVKNYLNALAGIFEKRLQPLKEDDLLIFQKALINADQRLTAKIGEYRREVELATKEVRALEAPKNLAWFHIKEIQLLQETWQGLLAMERLEQDPIAALAAIPIRKEVKLDIIKLHYKELRNWVKSNGIAFNAKEKGYRLVN